MSAFPSSLLVRLFVGRQTIVGGFTTYMTRHDKCHPVFVTLVNSPRIINLLPLTQVIDGKGLFRRF